MNVENTIKKLRSHRNLYETSFQGHFMIEVFDEALDALEKQLPKKPLPEERYYGVGKCPSCGAVFLSNLTNYCGNCGQMLDWDDVNKEGVMPNERDSV